MPKKDDRILFAFLAVFLTIIGFVIALAAKKDDKYVMFYAKQGLVLFFAALIVSAARVILRLVPILGIPAYWILHLVVLILWIIGIIYSLSGEESKIPIIGDFADKIRV